MEKTKVIRILNMGAAANGGDRPKAAAVKKYVN
jgi:hypothetical protein